MQKKRDTKVQQHRKWGSQPAFCLSQRNIYQAKLRWRTEENPPERAMSQAMALHPPIWKCSPGHPENDATLRGPHPTPAHTRGSRFLECTGSSWGYHPGSEIRLGTEVEGCPFISRGNELRREKVQEETWEWHGKNCSTLQISQE